MMDGEIADCRIQTVENDERVVSRPHVTMGHMHVIGDKLLLNVLILTSSRLRNFI